MLSKLALLAAVVAANEETEDLYKDFVADNEETEEPFEEDTELHNHFHANAYTRSYKFGSGWCGHAGSYVDYADINNSHRADQICSDSMGRHWTRLATGNGNFGGTVYHSYIYRWCSGAGYVTKFADINGDHRADMICDGPQGKHWLMPAYGNGYWNKNYTKYHSAGWCGHAGAYTSYADVNGDGKADMICDDTMGRHWTAYSRGNGTFYYKYHAPTYRWCGHSGAKTQWADINGDGKADMICDDTLGRHWSRLSYGYTFGPSTYHFGGWCRGGITRYTNWWYDGSHPRSMDMMCDIGSYHFSKASLGNGHFYGTTYKIFNSAWCYAAYTWYADVNGNNVSDLICSYKGGHWLLMR